MEPDILLLRQLLQEGKCCSQALVSVGLRLKGCKNEQLETAASALCLGIWGGLTCGALSGAAMVLTLFDESLAREELIPELTEWFKETYGESYGGTDCESILAGDSINRVLRCPTLMDEIWRKTRDLLEDEGFELEMIQN